MIFKSLKYTNPMILKSLKVLFGAEATATIAGVELYEDLRYK